MNRNPNRFFRFGLWAAALLALSACEAQPSDAGSPGIALVRQAVASGKPTIVEFGAKTCASCREMKVILDRVALSEQGKANVLIVDISEDWLAAQEYGIRMMPTQVLFGVSGREIGRHIGKLTEAEVLDGLAAGQAQ